MAANPEANPTACAEPSEEILDLLQRQAALYRELQTLAERQRDVIGGADTRPLLRLLADRQKLTDELTEVSGRIAPYRARWNELRDALTTQQREAADRLLREAAERLGRVIQTDEADARLLAVRKSQTATAATAVQAGQRMLAAYGARAGPEAKHLDRTDEESD
jgi:predicted nuclease with TOPRIM domain